MDPLTPPPEYTTQSHLPAAGPGPARGDAGDGSDRLFARLLAALGAAILVLASVLLWLPSHLLGGPGLYIIAYGIAALFGPVGFWLLGEAWRIRNRAVHGTELPPAHRRNLRILGVALLGIGVFVAFSGFGASGTLSSILNLVWGLTLAGYGIRSLLRSFASDRA